MLNTDEIVQKHMYTIKHNANIEGLVYLDYEQQHIFPPVKGIDQCQCIAPAYNV